MRPTAFLIAPLFLALNLPAADQQLVNMVMPDAKVVAGINVDSARNSPFGTFILRQASGNNAELHKFVDLTGFNPQTDLQEILVATPGAAATASEETSSSAPGSAEVNGMLAAAAPVHGLLLARGNFNVEKITTLAKTDGKQHVETYKDATLISDPKHGRASAMAFIGQHIA